MTKFTRLIPVVLLSITAGGLVAIKGEEGAGPVERTAQGNIVAKAYPDPQLGWAVPTICHGHTRGVFKDQRVSLNQCETWLVEDANLAGDAIKRCTPVKMTQGQYDVLVSMVVNIGTSAYCGSRLAREINDGNCHAAAIQINSSPQIDRKTGHSRIWNGKPIIDRQTGQVLQDTGKPIMKWTTSGGVPLPGLIKRRAQQRAIFEADCSAWESA